MAMWMINKLRWVDRSNVICLQQDDHMCLFILLAQARGLDFSTYILLA